MRGLGSTLNYMNEKLFSKDDPAINEHHYHIIKKKNNTKKHITYTILVKANLITLRNNNRYTDEHHYNI